MSKFTPIDEKLARDLLERCGQGEDRACTNLYRLTHGNVKRFVSGRLGARRAHDIDGVVNETFHQTFRSSEKFSRQSPVLAWIYGIAKKVMLKGFADAPLGGNGHDHPADGHDGQTEAVNAGGEEAPSYVQSHGAMDELPADNGRSAEDIVRIWKDLEAVDRCMKKLSAVQREVIELVFVDCMTQQEVAEIQGVTRDTVAQRLRHGRENVKSCVTKRHGVLL